jgi:hypothetical protein
VCVVTGGRTVGDACGWVCARLAMDALTPHPGHLPRRNEAWTRCRTMRQRWDPILRGSITAKVG